MRINISFFIFFSLFFYKTNTHYVYPQISNPQRRYQSKPVQLKSKEKQRRSETFGSSVFNKNKMRQYLTKDA